VPDWLRTTLRLTALVGVVSLASIVGLVLFERFVDPAELVGSGDSLGNYLQTVGAIYAVLLAFVVVVVWGQFNDARTAVNREAVAAVDVFRIATGLPDETCAIIQQGLRDYLDAVIKGEWEAMAEHDQGKIEKIGQRLDRVWSAIHVCAPCNPTQQTMYAEILARFNDLTELRTMRLVTASAKIPIAMNVLLYTGALILVGSTYLLPFDRLWLHAVVTAALAGATAHILFLIYDLDDAFGGDYQVDKDPFIRARRSFEREVPAP
jgi:hypothetical protein